MSLRRFSMKWRYSSMLSVSFSAFKFFKMSIRDSTMVKKVPTVSFESSFEPLNGNIFTYFDQGFGLTRLSMRV